MQAIPALMSVSRHCPSCDADRIVNHWIHSGVRKLTGQRIVRWMCGRCSTQVTDISKSSVSDPSEYVAVMSECYDMDVREVGDHTFVSMDGHEVEDIHFD